VAELARKRRAKETARFVEPTQCLPVAKLPEGSNWEYEFKFDWFLRESLAYFQSVIHELASDGCDAVALACTEIPLLIGQADSTLPLLDSTLFSLVQRYRRRFPRQAREYARRVRAVISSSFLLHARCLFLRASHVPARCSLKGKFFPRRTPSHRGTERNSSIRTTNAERFHSPVTFSSREAPYRREFRESL
jgi:hypothetical protein